MTLSSHYNPIKNSLICLCGQSISTVYSDKLEFTCPDCNRRWKYVYISDSCQWFPINITPPGIRIIQGIIKTINVVKNKLLN